MPDSFEGERARLRTQGASFCVPPQYLTRNMHNDTQVSIEVFSYRNFLYIPTDYLKSVLKPKCTQKAHINTNQNIPC